jgi:hypothetical protein
VFEFVFGWGVCELGCVREDATADDGRRAGSYLRRWIGSDA